MDNSVKKVDRTMEILEGLRGDYKVFLINEHLYLMIKLYDTKKYFRCIVKKCRASYVLDTATNTSRLLRIHNHEPDPLTVEHYRFLTTLRRRAREETIAPRALFAECQLGLSDEAQKRIGTFEKHKKIIYNARNSALPKIKGPKEPNVIIHKPKFTIFDGLRADTKVYLCNGYLYLFRKSFNHKRYYGCVNRSCQAKMIFDSVRNGSIISKRHNHPVDNIAVEYHKFLTTLRCRARQEQIGARSLFKECIKDLSPEAASKVGCFEKHKKIIYHARNNPVMPVSTNEFLAGVEEAVEEHTVPDTLKELNMLFDQPQHYKHHAYQLKQLRRIFLRSYEDGKNPQLIFILSSTRDSLAYISQDTGGLNLHIDTSFNTKTKHNFHMCCINVLYKKMVFPLMFSIMVEKTEDALVFLLNKCNEIKGEAVIYSVLTDLNKDLHQAIGTTMPDAIVKGCWFHFAKAVLFEAQNVVTVTSESERAETAVKMAMVLPLLPSNYYTHGVHYIKKYADLPQSFITYLMERWKNENLSTFGEDIGVHYSVELFGLDLQRVIDVDHQDIWKFMEGCMKMLYTKSSSFSTVKEASNVTVYWTAYNELIEEIGEALKEICEVDITEDDHNSILENEQAKFLKTHDVGSILQNLCNCIKGLAENQSPDDAFDPHITTVKDEDSEEEVEFEEIILEIVKDDDDIMTDDEL